MKWVMTSLETYFNDGSNKATQLPCVGIQHSVVCDVDIPGKTRVCWCTELGMTRWCQGLHKPFPPGTNPLLVPGLWTLNLESFPYTSFGSHTQSLSWAPPDFRSTSSEF